MEYVVFDLETTGFDPIGCEIIEIGAVRVKDGLTVDKYHSYIKPKVSIPFDITRLTGITNELVRDCEPEEVVLAEFFEWLGDAPIIGHNSLHFDYKFIKTRGECAGLDFSLNGQRIGWDTCLLAKEKLEIEHHSLTFVKGYFGIKLDGNAHTAMYDAMVTKLVFDRFILNNLAGGAFNYEEELRKEAEKQTN
jgi:DNA polymerase-3 subunit alpha (Gram-positive type)